MKIKSIILLSFFGLFLLASTCREDAPPCYSEKRVYAYDSLELKLWNTAKFNIAQRQEFDTLYRNGFAFELDLKNHLSYSRQVNCEDHSTPEYTDSIRSVTIWGIDLEKSDTTNLTSRFIDSRQILLPRLASAASFYPLKIEPTDHRLIPFKALFKVEVTFSSGKIFSKQIHVNFWK